MNTHALALGLSLMLVATASSQVRELGSPAGERSGEPNLVVAADGRVLLSWIEPSGDGHALRFAVRDDDGWSSSKQIASGDNWFVNWADFPSMVAFADGALAAHWLVKSAKGTFDYDIHISRSTDDGATWSEPLLPHRDGKHAEHGFVSLLANKDGVLSAVWLDGREMKPGGGGHGRGAMTLRYAEILPDGTLTREAVLDPRVCECCSTSAAQTEHGPVVVYRDRSQREVRDIAIVRRVKGKWSKPRLVNRDGWEMHGCPVNGPSVAAAGRHVAVAWFTGADNRARVKLALSSDAGETFAEPVLIDRGNPTGRVEVLVLPSGDALVCWLTQTEGGGAIRLRRVTADGSMADAVTIAVSGTARRNGFPQMVYSGDELLFAWTDKGVKTASLRLR